MNRHAWLIKLGLDTNPAVVTRLINDCTQSSSCNLNYAHKLFDQVPQKDTTLWTSLISAYTRSNHPLRALQLFSLMTRQPGSTLKPNHFVLATIARAVASSPHHLPLGRTFCGPDEFTVATVLAGCGRARDLVFGMQIHGYAIVSGFEAVFVNPISNMYFQCGKVCCAERVLDGVEGNVVSKLVRIRGYVFNQRYRDVIDYVASENNMPGIFEVDGTMYVPLLSACAELSLLNVGRQVHGLLIAMENSSEEDGAIIGSALINMYCKCNSVAEAQKVFDAWPTAQVALWNSMISGYMYNGLVENARELWEEMPEKNVISWTSMISGYVQNGMPREGLSLLAKMYSHGDGSRVEGNCFTCVAGLEACSHLTNLEKGKQIHAKLTRTLTKADIENVVIGTALVDMYSKSVDKGLQYFRLMREKYRIIPREDHFTCLIDMLGRAGRLDEAWALVDDIEEGETSDGCVSGTIWAAMLGACQLHGNVEMGRRVANKMLESKKQVSMTYVALSNVYAAAGMWNEAYRVRENWRKEEDDDMALLDLLLIQVVLWELHLIGLRLPCLISGKYFYHLDSDIMSCFLCFSSHEKKSTERTNSRRGGHVPASAPHYREARTQQRPENPRRVSAEATNEKVGTKEGANNIAAQTFTFRELAAATKNFRQECLVGEGGFGRVYKGQLEKTGQAEPIFKEPTRYTELADPLLEGNFPVKCFNQAVAVAAMCLHGDASIRPLMRDVVTALSYLGLGPLTGSVSPLSDPASPLDERVKGTNENNCDEVSAMERERAVAEALEWGSTSRHNKVRAMASIGSSV
ncbi:hypothetical protein C3L33_04317, partial [Rhododendron williamsianum]